MKYLWFAGTIFLSAAVICGQEQKLVVLGTAQDAGFPQIGAVREFEAVERKRRGREKVVALGIVDRAAGQKFLIEATPDLPEQLFALNKHLPNANSLPDGIFLTHAHIGHYTGLMYLGREAIGASHIAVYAMPRMKDFLTKNAPWSQLVTLDNIKLSPVFADTEIALNANLKITPFLVPHRDELSETVGYEIAGKRKKAVFIPDVDKWSKWRKNLVEVVKDADYVLLDATFYRSGETSRDMSEVPHPFVVETIDLLKNLPATERAKVYFIHFNHSNPLLDANSREAREVLKQGFNIAIENLALDL